MTELAAIITAFTGLLTALGVAAKFLWNKIEARFTDIEQRGQECEERAAVQTTVIELLWRELERIVPEGSPVLARAHRLLGNLKGDGR